MDAVSRSLLLCIVELEAWSFSESLLRLEELSPTFCFLKDDVEDRSLSDSLLRLEELPGFCFLREEVEVWSLSDNLPRLEQLSDCVPILCKVVVEV